VVVRRVVTGVRLVERVPWRSGKKPVDSFGKARFSHVWMIDYCARRPAGAVSWGGSSGGEVERERSVEVGHDVAVDKPGVQGVEHSRPGLRERYIRRSRTTNAIYRAVVAVVGSLVIVGGVILLPLPGPGWLIIFVGLGILASEFAWAQRVLDFAKAKVFAWTAWVSRQSLLVRALIGLGCLAIVAAAVGGYVWWQGVPSWLPWIG
jgi:uncharacterized protein (TIGR02611 family)